MDNYDNNYGWTTPGSQPQAEPVKPETQQAEPSAESQTGAASTAFTGTQGAYTEPAGQTPASTQESAGSQPYYSTGTVPGPRAERHYQNGQSGYYGSYYSGPFYQQGSTGGYTPPGSYYSQPTYSAPATPATTTKTKSHNGRNWALIAIAMLLVALVAGFGGGYLAGMNGTGGRDTVVYRSPDAATGTRTGNIDSTSLSAVANAAGESVVSIITENIVTNPFAGGEVQSGAGSGVIISEDGYIITNNHVISGADKVVVTLADGTELEAEVIGSDAASDVGVLKVNATGLVPAVIGDDSQMLVGDLVLAIGNPMGTLGGTVTDGIISALSRDVTIDGNTMNLMQMSAAVSPGNSGGGLFNANAELIGIVNAKSNGDNTEGLGFAIPISHAMSVAEDLINLGYVSGRPGLGVNVRQISSAEQALQYGVSELGLYIEDVNAGSAAEAAGIQPGDKIVSFGGTEVSTTQELSNAISKYAVGDTVEMVLSRSGQRVTVSITLQELQVTN